ncbi:hypothetical protein [Methanoculleus sp. UBA303]|jgi:DNA-binding transcriptional MerR regulator|uniref:hypothetical protein n=1 Tax=Methanoculleus sp. UBA303 TaxID=1915497 RepID=UPI0025DE94F3|nr:hypothetical protein [Methanoculleus sp. UBA303]
MSEKELKIGDIAHLTGISEQDVRTLVQTYNSLFTYRTIGPVRLFPQKAVRVVRGLVELSGRGLTSEEIVGEVRSGRRSTAPEEPAEEIGQTDVPLPAEVVLDIRVMQETLARQERRIARLAGELEREQELRREETGQLQQALDRLQERLDGQQEELAVVAEWVAYFDQQMDEVSRPVLERVRRTFGKKNAP